MIIEEVRSKLPKEAVIFDDPSYDNSIIGVTFDDRVIYDYDFMIQEMIAENKWTEQEAIEWIEYNAIQSLSHFSGRTPIVVRTIE